MTARQTQAGLPHTSAPAFQKRETEGLPAQGQGQRRPGGTPPPLTAAAPSGRGGSRPHMWAEPVARAGPGDGNHALRAKFVGLASGPGVSHVCPARLCTCETTARLGVSGGSLGAGVAVGSPLTRQRRARLHPEAVSPKRSASGPPDLRGDSPGSLAHVPRHHCVPWCPGPLPGKGTQGTVLRVPGRRRRREGPRARRGLRTEAPAQEAGGALCVPKPDPEADACLTAPPLLTSREQKGKSPSGGQQEAGGTRVGETQQQ